LTLQEGLVGFGDEVHDVIEDERRAEQAFHGLILFDRRDEGDLKLGVQPDVTAHQDQRIDGLVQGDAVPVEPLRIAGEVIPGPGEGVVEVDDLKQVFVEMDGLRQDLFVG
jgi:hypothetical protein